jgi:type I restriction enzyme, S subunit
VNHGWRSVLLSEVLRERVESPDAEAVASGTIGIIAKIGFNDGRIVLRANSVTNTDMVLVRPGDIVLSGINAVRGAIALHNDFEEPLAATIHYSSYEVDRSKANPRFIWWLLRSGLFRRVLVEQVPSGIKSELNARRLLKVNVPMPELSIQNKVVTRLDEVSNSAVLAREATRDSARRSARLMESILGKRFSRFQVAGTLEDVLTMKPRNGPAFATDPEWEGTPVVMPSATTGFGLNVSCVEYGIGNEAISEKDRLRTGDILIARGNKPEQVGNAGIVPDVASGWVCASLLMRTQIDPALTDREFVIFWLRSPKIRRYVREKTKGTSPSIQKINQKVVLATPFPSNVSREVQTDEVRYLNTVEAEVNSLRTIQGMVEDRLSLMVPTLADALFRVPSN